MKAPFLTCLSGVFALGVAALASAQQPTVPPSPNPNPARQVPGTPQFRPGTNPYRPSVAPPAAARNQVLQPNQPAPAGVGRPAAPSVPGAAPSPYGPQVPSVPSIPGGGLNPPMPPTPYGLGTTPSATGPAVAPSPAAGTGTGFLPGSLPAAPTPAGTTQLGPTTHATTPSPRSSMPSTAAFFDPTYGPYVPTTSAGSGTVAGFGTFNPTAPVATLDKPFSNYSPPPTYSPYNNLYRGGSFSPVDNYYSLVRPFVQQNALNRQYRDNLQGLRINNQFQQSMIQRLQQQNQMIQGTYRPNYYMNQGNYFPGQGF